ncbi:97 kDa heat shock protein [Hydra vulgaris]|uniref:97 kDa heat shock protein n=1 Tax=Hydra vulgaris TaxID=6087 RepID=A0ABM4D4J6_HYDVU
MSVVGFDIGNSNCFVAVAKAGGIETVANEYSDRCTPAIVAFNAKQRLVGISAKNQMAMNYMSTISQFKRFIGHRFDEPQMKHEFQFIPNKVVPTENGSVGFQVQYKSETKVFSAEQIVAMLLTELKQTAQENLKIKVTDCVISVPSYFTDFQRRSVLNSAQIAGLNCLKLMNDTTAVALNYGLFKQDLPAADEKSKNVAFVDMGHSSFQVCIASFNKGKIKVLSSASDPNLGGRDFDQRLMHYFADDFIKKYKVDAKRNAKAWSRLESEVEKLKKQMSTNSTNLPLSIECFLDDKDVSSTVNRAQFEEMSQDLFARIEAPLKQALQDSGLKAEDIEVVELVGGSMRMPAIQTFVSNVFGKPISTTLNLDEAVARGCAIQCAMLSHTVKVRDIEVMDVATYPITISWDSVRADEQTGEMEVFKKYHSYPFTKMLTFPHRVEPFKFNAFYGKDVVLPNFERKIGEFVVNAAAPTESSDTNKVKVKVKVKLDIHGCFTVSGASMVEILPEPPAEIPKEEPMEAQSNHQPEETKKGSENVDVNMDSENNSESSAKLETSDKKKQEKKIETKKKTTKTTELSIVKHQDGLSSAELNYLVEVENELVSQIRLEKERADARNKIEEYIYKMRDKIHSDYYQNITDTDRDNFSALLTSTENWLYDEGEELHKQVYIDKLAELQKIGNPVADRHIAHANIPAAFELLGTTLTHYKKILDLYSKKDELYSHIDEADMKKVSNQVDEKFAWFNEKMQAMGQCPKHCNPVIFPSQINVEAKLLKDFCDPIVNKPKVKVPPKEPANTQKKANETTKENMETDQTPAANENKEEVHKPNGEVPSNLDMEVD